MRHNIIVFFIVFILLIISYKNKAKIEVNKEVDKVVEKEQKKENKTIMVAVNYQDETKKLDLEEYVLGVVSCEMPASFESEALKAMALASRTYALYKMENNPNYVLSSSTSDQCFHDNEKLKRKWKDSYDKYYKKVKTAIIDTEGEYISYHDKPIYAAYFSISNGKTENSEDVFVSKKDYLVGVDSSWDKEYSYKQATKEIKEKDFLNKLGINGDKIENIKIEKCKHGRVSYITINGKKIKGTKVRSLLSLKSTDFQITHKNGIVTIKTKGYGHGVGMSQYGANEMAKKGYTYDEIIKYYYTGVEILNK